MLSRLLWQSPQYLPVALGAGVIATLITLWLYRPQLRMLPSPWQVLAPGLRLAAIGALLLALLKPTVLRSRAAGEQGTVLMLIDRSRSMSVADTNRSPSHRIALADALGLLPAGMRPLIAVDLREKTEQLRPMVETISTARSEVDYAQLSGRGIEAATERLHDDVVKLRTAVVALGTEAPAKMNDLISNCRLLVSLLDPANQMSGTFVSRVRSRVDMLANSTSDAQAASDADLYRNSDIARAAADSLTNEPRLQLVKRAISDPTAGLIANLPQDTPVQTLAAEPGLAPVAVGADLAADGDRSDLSGSIAAVRQQLRNNNVQAVLLFSDGRQVGGSNGAAPALDVPVFTIGVGTAMRKDIAISRFDVPPSVFVGETATAQVDLASAGMRGEPVDVSLTGLATPTTQHVVIGDAHTPLSFPIKFDKPGVQVLTASLSGGKNDTFEANNVSQRRVKVLADKIAVAVIGGSAGWDYQYLRNALLRTPWLKVDDEIVRPGTKLHLTPDEILAQQVLVLDDVDPQDLSPEQWDAAGKLASERGGGVIIIAGDDVSPKQLASQPVLAEMLPWLSNSTPSWKIWPGERPGIRIIPASGEASGVVKLSDDPLEDRRRWSQLPAIFRALPIKSLKPNVRTLLIEGESGGAILTEARDGAGRTLFFGANETWRWRYKIGERDQDRFFLQLVREAGESPYAVRNQTMALDLDAVSVVPQQAVHVRARLLDDSGKPLPAGDVSAHVQLDGKDVQSVPMTPAVPGAATGRFVATLPPLDKGSYDVRLFVGGKSTDVNMPLQVEPSYEAEMTDLSGDDNNLRRLAEASGGSFMRLDQFRTLPAKLDEARERRPQSMEYPLWDSPYLFLFVLGCAGLEWATRKRFGLV